MEVRGQHRSLLGLVLGGVVCLAAVAAPDALYAQKPAPASPQVGQQQLTTYAQAYIDIGEARSEIQAQFAEGGNKTDAAQAQLREQLRQRVSQILEEHGLSLEQYQNITFVVSSNQKQRDAFNQILARLTGEGAGTETGG